jgi:hypothetical protein
MNDPIDLALRYKDEDVKFECFEIPCEAADEQTLKNYIADWIKANNVGFDKGTPIIDRTHPKNTIGKESHWAPGKPLYNNPEKGCKVEYWVTGQNCAWWATSMVGDVGIDVSQEVWQKMLKYNNTGQGIVKWNIPGELKIIREPGAKPVSPTETPGCPPRKDVRPALRN